MSRAGVGGWARWAQWPWRQPAPPPKTARCHHTHRPSPGAAPAATSRKRVGLRQPASLSTYGRWFVVPPRAILRALCAPSHSLAFARRGPARARPGSRSAPGLGSPASEGAHLRCVNGDLASLPKWQSICQHQHFDPARVRQWQAHSHVAEKDVGGDTCAGFAAHACGGPLQGRQHPCGEPHGGRPMDPAAPRTCGVCGSGAHRRLSRCTRI